VKASVVRQSKKVYCEMIGMGAKSITIVRAVRRISPLTVGQLRSLRMSELETYHGASTIMAKTLD
jgi:hypothetical protein